MLHVQAKAGCGDGQSTATLSLTSRQALRVLAAPSGRQVTEDGHAVTADKGRSSMAMAAADGPLIEYELQSPSDHLSVEIEVRPLVPDPQGVYELVGSWHLSFCWALQSTCYSAARSICMLPAASTRSDN
jgi:hypothetical protein